MYGRYVGITHYHLWCVCSEPESMCCDVVKVLFFGLELFFGMYGIVFCAIQSKITPGTIYV